MSKTDLVEPVIKEACLLSQADWGARIEYHESGWHLSGAYRLTRQLESDLLGFIGDKTNAAWLGGALTGGRSRSRTVALAKRQQKIYIFPSLAGGDWLFIAGTQTELGKENQQAWRLASRLVCHNSNTSGQTHELQQAVRELEEIQQELQARISAQHEAEARLVQAAKLAAVGEMAAGIAHELNNPLTTVVGFTELSLDALPLKSPVRHDLELVLREANRARSVVRRLLDFARQREVLRIRADLNEIVDDVLALTKHLLMTSNVELQLHIDKDLPWAFIDRNQIKQVLINLINNALYAMPEGGRLTIETGVQTRHSAPFLALCVRDSGTGISPENLERIFEPFFTTRGDKGGTGLGLSVTYGIVTEHGGTIEVESRLEAGSAFTVLFPMEPQA